MDKNEAVVRVLNNKREMTTSLGPQGSGKWWLFLDVVFLPLDFLVASVTPPISISAFLENQSCKISIDLGLGM